MRATTLLATATLLFASQISHAGPEATKRARWTAVSRLIKAAVAQKTPSKVGAVADLIARAKSETDPNLQKFTQATLVKTKMPLLREQKREVLSLVRDETCGLLPKNPPIPRTGAVEIRHYSMSDFYQDDIEHFRSAGFQVTENGSGAVATRGRLHVVVYPTHENILSELANPDVHVITYNGHSQIGGVVEQALQQPGLHAPNQRKLVALFQCIGIQDLPFLKSKAPNVDVITSNTTLFVKETPGLVQALYTGLEKGEGYQRIRRRVDEAAWKRGRVLYPNQVANLDQVDFEPNGELDVNRVTADAVKVYGSKATRSTQGLMSGVHFLRSMNPYYVEESTKPVFGADQVNIPVISKGLASSGDGSRVAHVVERTDNGRHRFEVALDPKFQNESRAFIGAASVFDLQMHLQKTFLGVEDKRMKVRAMAFAADYLDLIPRDRVEAETAFNRLARMQGLSGLSLYTVQSALGGHVVNEEAVDRLMSVTGSTP